MSNSIPIRDYPAPPTLVVAGVVGPVAHAQGPSAGRRSSVIQLGGCNLSCSWCDSAFTWDTSRFDLSRTVGYWPVTEIAAAAMACSPSLVVLSGGEPLLQQKSPGWTVLLESLVGVEIGVETNGTLMPSTATLDRLSWTTVSPKLAHSGDPAWARIAGDVLVAWGQAAVRYDIDFSFAIRDLSDVTTVRSLVAIHGLPADRVWIVPETTSTLARQDVQLDEAWDAALGAGFNVSRRLSTGRAAARGAELRRQA